MPRIDARSGDIVIRIVYDGMPEAGKTTNIHQLFGAIPLQRRGNLASPDVKGRRTEFFDWLDFAGGFVDGRRVRCQLVSVPGQPQLLHRRRYLLESADAVVYVADSQPASADDNRACLAQLGALLESFGEGVTAAIVVQANKQDLPGALRPRTLAEVLSLPIATPVVPAVAQAGRGVMDTFVLAARLAVDRVRELMLGGVAFEEMAASEASAESLHATMLALERPAAQEPAAPAEITRADREALLRSRPNDVETARTCTLPKPEALLAGHVWPPVKGRAAFAAASAGALTIPDRALDWAPEEPLEIGIESGWVLHSSARWVFATENEARSHLMTTVRAVAAHGDLVPEGRAIFVAPDPAGFRVWMLTPSMPSLAAELLDAAVKGDGAAIASALESIDRAADELAALRGSSKIAGGSGGVASRGGRLFVLGVGEGEGIAEHAASLAARAKVQGKVVTRRS
jgi:signal recognition particle receptor subunit beta